MITYISNPEVSKRIESLVYEIQETDTSIFISSPIRATKINLLQIIKGNLVKSKEITTVIIDLSIVKDDSEDIIKGIKVLNFYNKDVKVIVLAFDYERGNKLLSDLVKIGVSNIITNENNLEDELKFYLYNNSSYEDAKDFIVEEEENIKSKKFKFTNKDIEKKNTKKFHKHCTTISIVGSNDRVGVTHISTNLAYTLIKNKKKVAVIQLGKDSISYIKDEYRASQLSNEIADFYRIENIDFYKYLNLKKINMLKRSRLYDYIIIDLGSIKKDITNLRGEMDLKIYVTCSKWHERQDVIKFIKNGSDYVLNYSYIFNLSNEQNRKEIQNQMQGFKYYFSEYKDDLFMENKNLLKVVYDFEGVATKTSRKLFRK